MQEYGFRVEREKKESERKQIEANGIRDFQQTVTQGISDSYVRWRGIEATLQLAQSPNTKIVIIGSGKDGLPVILGNVDTPIAAAIRRRRPHAPAARQQRGGQAEAGRRQPAVAGKNAGQQPADPAERPSPTAVPRASPNTPQATQPGPPPNSPLGGAPAAAQTAAPPAEPRSTWTWSEIQELIARAVRPAEPGARPSLAAHGTAATSRHNR